jgi:hypothetical protein
MIHLIYVSSATKEMTEDQLFYLLKQSRLRNLRQNVTGMLLYVGGNFIQVLEGAEKDVEEIYGDIVKDDRNTGNIVIEKIEIRERAFPNWSMKFKRLTEEDRGEVAGFTELLNKTKTPKEIADRPNDASRLLNIFSDTVV